MRCRYTSKSEWPPSTTQPFISLSLMGSQDGEIRTQSKILVEGRLFCVVVPDGGWKFSPVMTCISWEGYRCAVVMMWIRVRVRWHVRTRPLTSVLCTLWNLSLEFTFCTMGMLLHSEKYPSVSPARLRFLQFCTKSNNTYMM